MWAEGSRAGTGPSGMMSWPIVRFPRRWLSPRSWNIFHDISYISRCYTTDASGVRHEAGRQDAEVAMSANKTRVLLVLPEDVLGQARVFAGRATAALKLPVSLQIVLRALIQEGLKRDGDRALLANVEGQALAVRHLRSGARRSGGAEGG